MTGSIPDVISNSSSMNAVNLSGNCFSGTVPQSFTLLTNLRSLDLSHNSFVGNLESKFTYFNAILVLFLQANQFSGNLDRVFDPNMTFGLYNVDISDNRFSGNFLTFNFLTLYLCSMWSRIDTRICVRFRKNGFLCSC